MALVCVSTNSFNVIRYFLLLIMLHETTLFGRIVRFGRVLVKVLDSHSNNHYIRTPCTNYYYTKNNNCLFLHHQLIFTDLPQGDEIKNFRHFFLSLYELHNQRHCFTSCLLRRIEISYKFLIINQSYEYIVSYLLAVIT